MQREGVCVRRGKRGVAWCRGGEEGKTRVVAEEGVVVEGDVKERELGWA